MAVETGNPNETGDNPQDILIPLVEFINAYIPDGDPEIPASLKESFKKGEKQSKQLLDKVFARVAQLKAEADKDFITKKTNGARAELHGQYEAILAELAGLTPDELKEKKTVKEKVEAVKAAHEAKIRELAGAEKDKTWNIELQKAHQERDKAKADADSEKAARNNRELESRQQFTLLVLNMQVEGVLKEFKAALKDPDVAAHLPWIYEHLNEMYKFDWDNKTRKMTITSQETGMLEQKPLQKITEELLKTRDKFKASHGGTTPIKQIDKVPGDNPNAPLMHPNARKQYEST